MLKRKTALIVFVLSVLIILGSDFYRLYASFNIPIGEVADGFVSVSEMDFDKTFVYPISGQWRYESELYPERKGYVQVPSQWNDESAGLLVTDPIDIGVLTMTIQLPEPGYYALQIDYISSAYQVLIDDQLVFESGRVGDSFASEIPSWRPQHISFYTEDSQAKIAIRMSNFHHYKRGVIRHMFIGKQEAIFGHMMMDVIRTLLFVGISFGMGIYVLFLTKLHLWSSSLYYLAAMSFVSAILQLIRGINIVYYFFPYIEVAQIIKMQYFFIGAMSITTILFVYLTYCRQQAPKFIERLVWGWIGLDLLYMAFVLWIPSFTLLNTNPFNFIVLWVNMMMISFLFILSIFYGNRNGKLSSLIYGVVILYVGLDSVSANQYSYLPFTSNSGSTGFLCLIIGQVYIMTLIIERELEASAKGKDMEIAFLQSQIAPHFFFNTLNTLMGVMEESVEDAQNLLLDFSQYLRAKFVFARESEQYGKIEDELALVHNYVRIEKKRFAEKIVFYEDIDQSVLDYRIPRLMIQPLIENAIRYGYHNEEVVIGLSVQAEDDGVRVTVTDNGDGFTSDQLKSIKSGSFFERSNGVGLKSIYLRLKAHEQNSVSIEQNERITTISYTWRMYENSNR